MSRKGYEATSMNDIADAAGLTKAGLYHYIRSKEELLFGIMSYYMDIVDEAVIAPTRDIVDPEERLRAIVERHLRRILEGVAGVTTLLEEHWALTPAHRKIIRNRQRVYADLVRQTIEQLAEEGKLQDVDPAIATFSLFGIILWISRWYSREGRLTPDEALRDFSEIALSALLKDGAASFEFAGLRDKIALA